MANEILENQIVEETTETYDTSDPKQVNKARKRDARKRADRLKFIEAAMSHEEGRAWFYDLLLFCKVISTPYKSDPYDTAFACGMNNVGLRIMQDIQDAAPDRYLDMVKEARQYK